MIKKIGKHAVQHSDIMNTDLKDLMGGMQADFMYSDPPWGQGNLRYWQTMNKKMTGAERNDPDYTDFLNHYFDLVAEFAKDRIVVEYGIQWADDVIKICESRGFKHQTTFKSIYASQNLPLDIHFFSKTGTMPIPDDTEAFCSVTKGYKLVSGLGSRLIPDNAELILDPCCGMGYSAQLAIDNGLAFRGNELNEARLQKTIARLEKDKAK